MFQAKCTFLDIRFDMPPFTDFLVQTLPSCIIKTIYEIIYLLHKINQDLLFILVLRFITIFKSMSVPHETNLCI